MSTAPDLTMARSTMRERMTDLARVARDVQGTGDDVFDPITGNVTPPDGDTAVIYEGPALVTRLATLANVVVIGSVDEARERYQVSIPFESPPVRVGDWVTLLATADPDLVGVALLVRSVAYGTHVARRRMTCELATPALRS